MFRFFILSTLLFCFQLVNSQNRLEASFGQPSYEELNMEKYSEDPEAAAVVLFEQEKNYVKIINNAVKLVIEVHRKIKVFDPEKFDGSEVSIDFYSGEKFDEIKAITHTGNLKTFVKETNFYENNVVKNYNTLSFTFPNIEEGSILEYKYVLLTENLYRWDGWSFQGTYPKMYTEYDGEIPGNYRYNKVLVGQLPLYINSATLKEGCFFIEGYAQNADCEKLIYAMKDVPAFEKEEYMLSEKNFVAALKLELREYTNFSGHRHIIANDWGDAEDEIRMEMDFGKQLKKNSYFEDKVPFDTSKSPLENAKGIYLFIQNHFSSNGQLGVFGDKECKEAFENKSGSITEINLSLINALQAHDFNANLVFLSTRDNGLPTTAYPVISEFNYAVCHLNINGEQYLLDASDKYLDFGMLPFNALNNVARVIDYKNDSFWVNITPGRKNVAYTKVKASIDGDGLITGDAEETLIGYDGYLSRKKISNTSLESYFEEKIEGNDRSLFNDLKVTQMEELDKPLKISFGFENSLEYVGDKIFLNPFFLQGEFKHSPFTLEKRTYPVEFGYPFSIIYALSLDLGEEYKVETLPEEVFLSLPDGLGNFKTSYLLKENELIVTFNLKIVQERLEPSYYEDLKSFFSSVAEAQKNFIELKKS